MCLKYLVFVLFVIFVFVNLTSTHLLPGGEDLEVTPGTSFQHEQKPPHIVFILADDLGWNDVSFHGSDQIPTPNIDSLAYHGIILNRHYTQPVCTPTRASLMTGKYPAHTGIHSGFAPQHRAGLGLSEKLLPQYLKELGYATHLVGKWHLGFYKRDYTPLARGFDSHLGLWSGAINYYSHYARSSVYLTPSSPNPTNFAGLDFRSNYAPAWNLSGQYATDVFTSRAVELVEAHPPEQPLFLYLAHTAVHLGSDGGWLQAPQSEVNHFHYIKDPKRRKYAAMVAKLDKSVGSVVEALDKKGMLNSSIIVFLSDNGAPNIKSSNYGSNYPWRGQKQTLWEGGVRTPAVIWSPLIEQSSQVSYNLMHITDWLPTLLDAAGYDMESFELEEVDGVSHWASISQGLFPVRRHLLLDIDKDKQMAAAIIDNYKYVHGPSPFKGTNDYNNFLNLNTIFSTKTPKYEVQSSKTWKTLQKHSVDLELDMKVKYLRQQATVVCVQDVHKRMDCTSEVCLFNTHSDPCEQHNVAGEYPEIVEQFTQMIDVYRRSSVPRIALIVDPLSRPECYDGVWSSWLI